jgi:hypothetical protein
MLDEVRIRNTKDACFLSYVVDSKINIYTKTSMIIYKLNFKTYL